MSAIGLNELTNHNGATPHVRKQARPYPAGKPLPTFTLTLEAEGNECVSRFAITADATVDEVEDGVWTPDEPEGHTDTAVLDVAWPDGRSDTSYTLSGDQWRDLENYGLFDEFMLSIADGISVDEALERTLAEIPVDA